MQFVGGQPGSGRPRQPRVIEVMRERIEQDIDRILRPYFDALEEAVLHATFEGSVIVSDVPDLGARIAAAEKLLDRVYGKPRQAMEHSGPDRGGVPIELSAEGSKAVHEFLARVRGE